MTGQHPIDERLADWVDDRMSARERERFEAELRANPELRAQAEEYRRHVAVLREALGERWPGEPEADPELTDRIVASTRTASPPGRGRLIPFLASAAAAAALVAIYFVLEGWRPGAGGSEERQLGRVDRPAGKAEEPVESEGRDDERTYDRARRPTVRGRAAPDRSDAGPEAPVGGGKNEAGDRRPGPAGPATPGPPAADPEIGALTRKLTAPATEEEGEAPQEAVNVPVLTLTLSEGGLPAAPAEANRADAEERARAVTTSDDGREALLQRLRLLDREAAGTSNVMPPTRRAIDARRLRVRPKPDGDQPPGGFEERRTVPAETEEKKENAFEEHAWVVSGDRSQVDRWLGAVARWARRQGVDIDVGRIAPEGLPKPEGRAARRSGEADFYLGSPRSGDAAEPVELVLVIRVPR